MCTLHAGVETVVDSGEDVSRNCRKKQRATTMSQGLELDLFCQSALVNAVAIVALAGRKAEARPLLCVLHSAFTEAHS